MGLSREGRRLFAAAITVGFALQTARVGHTQEAVQPPPIAPISVEYLAGGTAPVGTGFIVIPASALDTALAAPAEVTSVGAAVETAEAASVTPTWGVTATLDTGDGTGVPFAGSQFLVVQDAWQPAGTEDGAVEALSPYVVSGDLMGVADWVGTDPSLVIDGEPESFLLECCNNTLPPLCSDGATLGPDAFGPEYDLLELGDDLSVGYDCGCADVVCGDSDGPDLDIPDWDIPTDVPDLNPDEPMEDLCGAPPSATAMVQSGVGEQDGPRNEGSGFTAGAFQVDRSGDATFEVPIAVPGGRSGVKPRLSIRYSSAAGNGLMGVGWRLTGASEQITRCGRSWNVDGSQGAAHPDEQIFCVGGRRLIEIGTRDGGVEYRTIEDPWVRYIADGPANDPEQWRAWTRSGQVLTFATKLDAEIPGRVGFATLAWLLTTEADRYGNNVEFEYHREGFSHRPHRILYTGGASAPERAVEFVYDEEGRPDPIARYVWGVEAGSAHRLTGIRFTGPNPGQPAGEYRFEYMPEVEDALVEVTFPSRLFSIQRCAALGACESPVQLEWRHPQPDYQAARLTICDEPDPYSGGSCQYKAAEVNRSVFVDLNGDGLRDIMFPNKDELRNEDQWWVAMGTPSGPAPAKVARFHNWGGIQDGQILPARTNGTGPTAQGSDTVIPADFDGDGKDDLLVFGAHGEFFGEFVDPFNAPNPVWHILKSVGDGTFTLVLVGGEPTERTAYPGMTRVMDVNGDSRPDLVYGAGMYPHGAFDGPWCDHPEATWRVRLTLHGFPGQEFDTGIPHLCDSGSIPLDVDGNGSSELLARTDTDADTLTAIAFQYDGALQWTLRPTNLPVPPITPDSPPLRYSVKVSDWWRLLDLNGDGRTDLIRLRYVGPPSPLIAFTSTGALAPALPFTATEPLQIAPSVFDDVEGRRPIDQLRTSQVADFWRDGTQDLAFRSLLSLEQSGLSTLISSPGQATLQPVTNIPGMNVVVGVAMRLADLNADRMTDLIYAQTSTSDAVLARSGFSGTGEWLVDRFRQGNGVTIEADFARLRGGESVREPATNCFFPEVCAENGRPVVSSHRIIGPNGIDVDVDYQYEGWKSDTRVGALGFAAMETTQWWRGSAPETTRTEFDNRTENVAGRLTNMGFRPTRVVHHVASAFHGLGGRRTETTTLMRARVLDWGIGTLTVEAERVDSITSDHYEFGDEVVLSETSVEEARDDFGRVRSATQVLRGFGDEFVTTSGFHYDDNDDLWLLGMLREATTQNCQSISGAPVECTPPQTSVATYDLAGQPETLTADPLGDVHEITYTRDEAGNITQVLETARDALPRVERFLWDDEGLFVICHINAEGHRIEATHDRVTGALVGFEDANRNTTLTTADEWGRPVQVLRPDGSSAEYEHTTVQTEGFAVSRLLHREATGQTEQTTLNVYGDTALRARNGFRAGWIYEDFVYDARGRLLERTGPYRDGEAPQAEVSYDYDWLGRMRETTHIDRGRTAVHYAPGLTTVSVGQSVRTVESDARGLPRRVTEADGTESTFVHDAEGRVIFVDGEGAADSTWSYDTRGRPRSASDTDRGTWTWDYDGFGQVVGETDAKGIRTEYAYDRLGRTTSRQTGSDWATWTWDLGSGGVGALGLSASPETQESYTYWPDGNLAGYRLDADQEAFEYSYEYDLLGRPTRTTYPSHGGRDLAVERTYHSRGFLHEVRLDAAPDILLWRADDRDDRGRALEAVSGSGDAKITRITEFDAGQMRHRRMLRGAEAIQDVSYGYNAIGQLESRTDHLGWGDDDPAERHEVFSNDLRFRIKGHDVFRTEDGDPELVQQEEFRYDSFGNLSFRTGAGDLRHDDPARPHALTSMGARQFVYDDNGGITNDGEREIDYNALRLPKTIRWNGFPTRFSYTANLQRWKKVSLAGTTVYAGGAFERSESPVQSVAVYTIAADGETVAEIEVDDYGQRSVRWVGTDRLGSPTVRAGTALDSDVDRTWFGPMGDGNPVTAASQGFTGHEHDPSTGLVNMKFRQYEPGVGQFSSPDPLRGSPYDASRRNPYAYVGYRPLDFVDPLGLEAHSTMGGLGSDAGSYGMSAVEIEIIGCPANRSCGEDEFVGGYVAGQVGAVAGGALSVNETPARLTSQAYPAGSEWKAPPPFWRWAGNMTAELAPGLGLMTPEIPLGVTNGLLSFHIYTIPSSNPFAAGQDGLLSRYETADDSLGNGAGTALRGAEALVLLSTVNQGSRGSTGCRGAACRDTSCFVAGTFVETADGLKAIEEIEEGDLVLGRSETTGEVGYKPAVRTMTTPDRRVISVEVSDSTGDISTLGVTPDHPFWVVGTGWTLADDLMEGDPLHTKSGEPLAVHAVRSSAERVTVYNLEIADYHTYFAGGVGAWVHNNCGGTYRNWNEFQKGTKGKFGSRTDASNAWRTYKQANGIPNAVTRSTAARTRYLKSLLKNKGTPKWMRPWLERGRVPPGHQVDHIQPLSIGGPDLPSNMRLQGTDLHRTHHRFYRPWQ